MDKKEFSKYLNEQIMKYEMSEMGLSRVVPIAQKTINRYRNAITCPSEYNQKLIIDYFTKLEKNELEKGERYVTKNDFANLNNPDPFDDDSIYANADQLKFFTPAAQDYILNNFYVFALIEEYELEFIRKIAKLSSYAEDKFLKHLEKVPVSFDMLLAGEMESTNMENKLSIYMKMIRGLINKPNRWHTKIDIETGEPKEVFRKEKRNRFCELCEDFYTGTGNKVSNNLFDVINETLSYSTLDWYYLFLLQRIQMTDLGNKNHYQTYQITESHRGGEGEYMTWRYLELLLQ